MLWEIRKLILAFRDAFTGGATTRRRARRKAMAPKRRCPTCQQKVEHSHDWRDHVQ